MGQPEEVTPLMRSDLHQRRGVVYPSLETRTSLCVHPNDALLLEVSYSVRHLFLAIHYNHLALKGCYRHPLQQILIDSMYIMIFFHVYL